MARRPRLVKIVPLTSFAFSRGGSLRPGHVTEVPADFAEKVCDGVRARYATDDESAAEQVKAAEARASKAEADAAASAARVAELEDQLAAATADPDAAADDAPSGDGSDDNAPAAGEGDLGQDAPPAVDIADVPSGSMQDVLDWVRGAPLGEDPTEGFVDRARAALVVEAEGDQRSTLIDPLERLVLDAAEEAGS